MFRRPAATQPVPVSPPAGIPPAPRRAGAFAALAHRNFRLFYAGQILSLTGTWMQSTALGWLVFELSDSEFLLGAVNAATILPILLFTLYAGVVADRLEKRKILLLAQTAMMVVALVLAVLTGLGAINVGIIFALLLLHGTGSAFEIPTRQAFFVELVGRRDLTNAIALNSSAFNLTRVAGPAAAGVLIGSVGIAVCFYLNAVSYLAVIAGLLAIRLPPFRRPVRIGSTREHLREGFRYLFSSRPSRTLVGLVAALSILGLPYLVLMPVFARDVLGAGAEGLGWLLAASGAGALAGGLTLAAYGGRARPGPLLLASAAVFCVLLAGFALSTYFALSLVLLAGAGFTLILSTANTNAILQTLVPDELRGRVMSVYVFVFLGLTPVGSLLAGGAAGWIGAPAAVAVGAVLLLLVVGAVWAYAPSLREVE